ncbi:MAG: hypothetical protein ABUK14_07395, partial [Desulfobacteria bacterium]
PRSTGVRQNLRGMRSLLQFKNILWAVLMFFIRIVTKDPPRAEAEEIAQRIDIDRKQLLGGHRGRF